HAVGREGRGRRAPGRRLLNYPPAVAYEFRLPDLGEGLTEAEIAGWLVAEGDEVAEDQPLVEVQTDKTTVEIPSPRAGTVLKILVEEGDVARVGAVIVVIGEAGEQLLRAVDGGKQAEAASEPVVAGAPARAASGRGPGGSRSSRSCRPTPRRRCARRRPSGSWPGSSASSWSVSAGAVRAGGLGRNAIAAPPPPHAPSPH